MDTQFTPSGPGEDDDLGHAGVRDLLAAQPSPGPMPDAVFAKITAALDQEQATRAAEDGLSEVLGLTAVSPLVRTESPPAHRQPPRRWTRVLAAAAGVAAVGLIGTLAIRGTGTTTGPTAALPGGHSSSPKSGTALHIQVSQAAYTQDGLARQARALLNAPAGTVAPTDAEAPAIGPIATQAGLATCLTALGEAGASAVTVDLATYEGKPAAIIVVTKGENASAYAVQRDCSTGDPKILQDSVPVP